MTILSILLYICLFILYITIGGMIHFVYVAKMDYRVHDLFDAFDGKATQEEINIIILIMTFWPIILVVEVIKGVIKFVLLL